MLPNLNALTDPKGPVVTVLGRLANAMFMLAESNNRLADAIERNGLPR